MTMACGMLQHSFVHQTILAVRSLRKNPGFALSALAILVLGIGANTAIFGIFDAVLLKPLPYPKPDSIVAVYHVPPQQSFPGMKLFAVSPANYLDWRNQNTVFESIAVIGGNVVRLGASSRPQSITLTVTEPEFFKVLGIAPAVGRAFTAEECQPGHDDVLLVSHAFAASQFGGPHEALGRSVQLNGRVRPALLTLLAAVSFVLLIACANTANLVLVRTVARRKELAIRSALGASSVQVLSPGLTETMLLALAAGALGVPLARSAQSLVLNALAAQLPRALDVRLDIHVLAFAFAASVFTGLAAGLIAGWRLTKTDLNEELKQGLGKTDAYSGGRRTRRMLVTTEVALALMLLVGAGLMVRSLWALRGVDPGFVSANVITMGVPIPKPAKEGGPADFYADFLPQVRNLAGVVSAAAVDVLPLSDNGSQQPLVIEGRPAEVFALQPTVAVRHATPGYFQTMRIPLIAGRDFIEDDTIPRKDRGSVVISRSMARQFWPDENPIGKHLRLSFSPQMRREVVGVVADVKERGLDVLDPVAMLYAPLPANEFGNMTLVARASGDPAALVSPITRVLEGINPELTVRKPTSMDELVATSLSQHRFSMLLFVALALLAFILAAVGIYSVLAYSVRSRTPEISVRMALGARIGDVLRLVVADGMKPALAGIALGALGASFLARLLSRLIYGVSPTDPMTFGAVALLVAAVAMAACMIPAWQATRVEPVEALRSE
jgi:predicted permease